MTRARALLRGRVYAANLIGEEKYYLVVSNNLRNAALGSALAARLTTTQGPAIGSIVRVPAGEAVVGAVVCDDLALMYVDEVTRDLGALSPAAMRSVEDGLRFALALG